MTKIRDAFLKKGGGKIMNPKERDENPKQEIDEDGIARRSAIKRIAATCGVAAVWFIGSARNAVSGSVDVTGPGGHASFYSSSGHSSTYLSTYTSGYSSGS
jgi:hypothetical protein